MRVLIFGGSGMLGHKLWQFLSGRLPETFVTLRGGRQSYKEFNIFSDSARVFYNIDVIDFPAVCGVLDEVRPDFILDCVGVTKRRKKASDPEVSMALNALFPKKLAQWAMDNNAKAVNFSTDCVFDGKTGGYTETSPTSAEDIYGRTKALGEIGGDNALTLRSSFIGTELSQGSELLEWFLTQSGTAKGYRNAIYSGLTTIELCRVVEKLLVDFPEACGLYNISSEPISKFDLLTLIKEKVGLDIEVIPDDDFFCNRSLDSSKFRKEFGYTPPSWEKMIDELAVELKERRR